MPTVNVDQQQLFEALGRTYTTDEFRELCFEFGIELEEDTSELAMAIEQIGEAAAKAQGFSDRPLYKIDIPANRYDLLCAEGITRALRIFLGKDKLPLYRLIKSPTGQQEKITITKETASIRPHVAAAILRNVKFNADSYESFIALQTKLHNTICRNRTLVAIGTHDYDTLKGPFTYEAMSPQNIKFKALNQDREMGTVDLFNHYRNNVKHIAKYLRIIEDSPVYPIIFDATRTVCSLPPIINGDHSKITLSTKNVFIECTGTDLTKTRIVLNTMVAMFSQYCADPFTIEPVQVVYPDGTAHVYPNVDSRAMTADIDYITSAIGISLSPEAIVGHLEQMGLPTNLSKDKKQVLVQVPITRSDILHACDIMEDVAIAYGFNKIPKTVPAVATIGKALPLNKLSDMLRRELALSGFIEVLPLTLCSHDENYAYLRRQDPGNQAVLLANPKTAEYQVVRTSLLPGILKTLRENKSRPLPLSVFEVADVVLQDESTECYARNERRVCVAYANKNSGFELVHGMLDRFMQMLNVSSSEWKLAESNSDTYFPGRQANIYFDGKIIGQIGILNPEIVDKFELHLPITAFEIQIEAFL